MCIFFFFVFSQCEWECLCELFSWRSAGLCWHAAARYFQGEQLRKCPWHILCTEQCALPRLARPAVTNNCGLYSPFSRAVSWLCCQIQLISFPDALLKPAAHPSPTGSPQQPAFSCTATLLLLICVILMARRHPQPDCLLKQVKRIQRPEKQEDFLS